MRRCPTIIDVIHRGEAEFPVDVVGLHGVRNTLNAHYALVEFNPVGNDGIGLGNVDLFEVLTLIPGFAQPYTLILAAVSAGKADQRAFVKGYTGSVSGTPSEQAIWGHNCCRCRSQKGNSG